MQLQVATQPLYPTSAPVCVGFSEAKRPHIRSRVEDQGLLPPTLASLRLLQTSAVPEEAEPASLEPNVEFYEPRTAQGSSLSPGVHAAVLARAGRLGDALRALRMAARIDLDDLTGTTAGGLHLATMGSVWQALVFGFAGVRPRKGTLTVDPRLPDRWRALDLRLRFRGSPVRIRIEHGRVDVEAKAPVSVEVVSP